MGGGTDVEMKVKIPVVVVWMDGWVDEWMDHVLSTNIIKNLRNSESFLH